MIPYTSILDLDGSNNSTRDVAGWRSLGIPYTLSNAVAYDDHYQTHMLVGVRS